MSLKAPPTALQVAAKASHKFSYLGEGGGQDDSITWVFLASKLWNSAIRASRSSWKIKPRHEQLDMHRSTHETSTHSHYFPFLKKEKWLKTLLYPKKPRASLFPSNFTQLKPNSAPPNLTKGRSREVLSQPHHSSPPFRPLFWSCAPSRDFQSLGILPLQLESALPAARCL